MTKKAAFHHEISIFNKTEKLGEKQIKKYWNTQVCSTFVFENSNLLQL